MRSKFLILLICIAGFNLAQDLEDLQNRARTAVSEKRFSDALTLYRTLQAGHPMDVDYILWVGRLSAWTGDYASALSLYSQALSLDPKNVDAMVGEANVQMWRHAYRDAFVLLKEASELAPSNVDVELAWSRYYAWQGDETKAKLHLAKSLALDAANQEALQLKESLTPDHNIELRIAYESDTLPGTTPGAIAGIDASYFGRKGEIGIAFARLDRFGEAGSRGGLQFTRKLGRFTNVRAAALFGSGGDIVAKQDLSLGMSRTVRAGLVLGADYRYIDFRSLKINAAIGSVDYYFEKPMWILTSYAANASEGTITPALLLRFNARVRQNLTVNAGYGHGTELFQLALPTEFGDFRRDSYISGISVALTKKTRAEATYTLARRSTGVFENVFLIAMVHRL